MAFCTITGLDVTADNRGFYSGHRAIWMERGSDNLITNFNVSVKM